MDERVKIHNKKRKIHYNYFDELNRIEEAVKYWKEMGFESLIREFKKFVQEL